MIESTVHVVYKSGIYGHGVWGIYITKDDAIKAAKDFAKNDRDGYHAWEVYEIPIGKGIDLSKVKETETSDGYMSRLPLFQNRSTNKWN